MHAFLQLYKNTKKYPRSLFAKKMFQCFFVSAKGLRG